MGIAAVGAGIPAGGSQPVMAIASSKPGPGLTVTSSSTDLPLGDDRPPRLGREQEGRALPDRDGESAAWPARA